MTRVQLYVTCLSFCTIWLQVPDATPIPSSPDDPAQASEWCWTPCNQTSCSCDDLVRVSPDVAEPRYGWGSVTHSDVGTISHHCHNLSSSYFLVHFPTHTGWEAARWEMQKRVDCPSASTQVLTLVCGYVHASA